MINTLKNCNAWIMFTLGAILVVVLALFLRGANPALGDSPGSLAANQSTTTVYTMAQTVTTLPQIATSSSCAARVITTGSSTIRMIMTDKEGRRPTESIGFIQAASTTTLYPAQDFGCTAVWIRGMTGTATIHVEERF